MAGELATQPDRPSGRYGGAPSVEARVRRAQALECIRMVHDDFAWVEVAAMATRYAGAGAWAAPLPALGVDKAVHTP